MSANKSSKGEKWDYYYTFRGSCLLIPDKKGSAKTFSSFPNKPFYGVLQACHRNQ